jgi:hypothetical protein
MGKSIANRCVKSMWPVTYVARITRSMIRINMCVEHRIARAVESIIRRRTCVMFFTDITVVLILTLNKDFVIRYIRKDNTAKK